MVYSTKGKNESRYLFFSIFCYRFQSKKKEKKVIVLSFPSAAFDLKCQEKKVEKRSFLNNVHVTHRLCFFVRKKVLKSLRRKLEQKMAKEKK